MTCCYAVRGLSQTSPVSVLSGPALEVINMFNIKNVIYNLMMRNIIGIHKKFAGLDGVNLVAWEITMLLRKERQFAAEKVLRALENGGTIAAVEAYKEIENETALDEGLPPGVMCDKCFGSVYTNIEPEKQ